MLAATATANIVIGAQRLLKNDKNGVSWRIPRPSLMCVLKSSKISFCTSSARLVIYPALKSSFSYPSGSLLSFSKSLYRPTYSFIFLRFASRSSSVIALRKASIPSFVLKIYLRSSYVILLFLV